MPPRSATSLLSVSFSYSEAQDATAKFIVTAKNMLTLADSASKPYNLILFFHGRYFKKSMNDFSMYYVLACCITNSEHSVATQIKTFSQETFEEKMILCISTLMSLIWSCLCSSTATVMLALGVGLQFPTHCCYNLY